MVRSSLLLLPQAYPMTYHLHHQTQLSHLEHDVKGERKAYSSNIPAIEVTIQNRFSPFAFAPLTRESNETNFHTFVVERNRRYQ